MKSWTVKKKIMRASPQKTEDKRARDASQYVSSGIRQRNGRKLYQRDAKRPSWLMFVSDQREEFKSRFVSWSLSHPRTWSVQTDTTGLVDFLHDEFVRVRDAQLETAVRISGNIVASQERIAEGIDRVNFGIDRISDGLESLAAAFEWGFDELVWQIEEQRKLLQQILEVLQKPLDTQAKELKARAVEACKNGWFEDALSDFAESEKRNRYDFTIHQTLGNIYLFEKKDPEKALEYYERAARYAKPKSAYHSSLAFLHIALIKYLYGDFAGAYEATSQAIALTPLLYEAHFQHAQYCANLGKYGEALDHIRRAVEGDRYYSVKVFTEKDFDAIRRQLTSLFSEIRNEKRVVAQKKTHEIQGLVEEAESQNRELFSYLGSTKTALNRALELLERGSLLDCLDAISEADTSLDSFQEELSEFTQNIEQQIREKTSEKEKKRSEYASKVYNFESSPRGRWADAIFLISFLFGLLFSFFLVSSYDSNNPSDISLRTYVLPGTIVCVLVAVFSRVALRVSKSRLRTLNERELKSLNDEVATLRDRLVKIQKKYRKYL